MLYNLGILKQEEDLTVLALEINQNLNHPLILKQDKPQKFINSQLMQHK